MSTIDLIPTFDDSEDKSATKALSRVIRGVVVLLCLGASFESWCVRRRKGIAQRTKSWLINLTAGARQENSRMKVEPDGRLHCTLLISFSR